MTVQGEMIEGIEQVPDEDGESRSATLGERAMDDLNRRIANLSPARQELFRLRLERESWAPPTPTIPRRVGPGPWPLSFAQQRLWFLNQLEPDVANYNEPTVFRIRGDLDIAALTQALHRIVERHEVLRTTYHLQGGQPVQVVADNALLDVPVVDLRVEPDPDMALQRSLRSDIRLPFDLSCDLALRARLYVVAPQTYTLLLVTHHIASDGWSKGTLLHELSVLYDAFRRRRPDPLPPPTLQYADYAIWQRERFVGDHLAQNLAFWTEALHDLEPLQIPMMRPRPSAPTYEGEHVHFQLSPDLRAGLVALARQEHATLFMVELAAFMVLLHRYSGQDDIAIGTPIANRMRPEIEPLIGFFANTLVMRSNLAGDPTFRDVLRRVRETAFAAYEHQDMPFERLVEALNPDRVLNRNPLFQVMFSVRNSPQQALQLAGLEVERGSYGEHVAKFDLTLYFPQMEHSLGAEIEYNRDLFDRVTIERMVGHLMTLLGSIVSDPDCSIAHLPLLTDAEQRQIVGEWNVTDVAFPPVPGVHALFEAQVGRTPDATALVVGPHRLTYSALNERANQLAHLLRRRGVAPGTIVGLCLPRSLDLYVSILGVLKAGGAYLPLDPAYPEARLAFMIEDADAALVLAHRDLAPLLPSEKTPILCLDDVQADLRREPVEPPPSTAGPDDLAYVIYTSGSTGRPKGVAMRHAAPVNLIQWHRAHPLLGQPMRTTQFHSFSFDVSFQEMFSTWTTGGELHVVPEQARTDVDALCHRLAEARIERVFIPPALLSLLASAILARPELSFAVRQVITAGEQLRITDDIRHWMAGLPEASLHNQYGPTETHVIVTEHILDGSPNAWPNHPPIGHPIANVRLYILDPHGEPVGVGVPGELHVGGPVLADGYLNRPALTNERFIDDPFCHTGGRLYRTGDRARWLPNGEVEFLGRLDQQVKLRGFRVEPGEIEAVLQQHPVVAECAVVAVEDERAGRRLIAYWVAQSGETVSEAELRAALGRELPAYMVPSAFIAVPALPRSAAGKLDEARLPPYDPPRAATANPRNALEATLARIWREVLGKPIVGVDDNFFDLGGHSLLAVQLVERIHAETGYRLPIASIFEMPTVARQARLLPMRTANPAWRSLVAIQPHGQRPPLFLIPPAAGTTLRFAPIASALDPDQPVYGLEPLGMDGETQAQDRIEDMAAHYIHELQTLQPDGPYLLVGACLGGLVALEMAQQLVSAGHDVPLLAMFDPTMPKSGPSWADRRTLRHYARRVRFHAHAGTLPEAIQANIWLRVRPFMPKSRRRPTWVQATEQTHHRASLRYTARPYGGHVVIFFSQQYWQFGYHERWRAIAVGPFAYRVFPDTTHLTLIAAHSLPMLGANLAEVFTERFGDKASKMDALSEHGCREKA